MKKDELYEMANEICREVLEKNKDVIGERISSALSHNSDSDGKIAAHDAAGALSAVSLTLGPELSAVITAKMLVKLGLVTLEDE